MKGHTDTFKLKVISTPLDKDHFDIHVKMSADCTNGQIVKCMVAIIHEFENMAPDCWAHALDIVMEEHGI